MRRVLILSCVVLAGCSASNNGPNGTGSGNGPEQSGSSPVSPPTRIDSPKNSETDDFAPSPRNVIASPGGIGVSAAPGVAFNYRYAFRVPNAKIAAVQEEHAQLCEKLGLAHCRITGMQYQLVNNSDISAMLAFKIDPALARQFGKDSIAGVNHAEGMLVDAAISGTDAGAAISAATREGGQAHDALNRIEAQLKATGLSSGQRANLEEQARELRDRINGAANSRADAEKSLATTPMVFHYGSGNLIPGFDGRSPLHDAAVTAQSSFTLMLSFVLIGVGALLPWALIAGLVFWIYRMFWRREVTKRRAVDAEISA